MVGTGKEMVLKFTVIVVVCRFECVYEDGRILYSVGWGVGGGSMYVCMLLIYVVCVWMVG